jgi:hypothetical protein
VIHQPLYGLTYRPTSYETTSNRDVQISSPDACRRCSMHPWLFGNCRFPKSAQIPNPNSVFPFPRPSNTQKPPTSGLPLPDRVSADQPCEKNSCWTKCQTTISKFVLLLLIARERKSFLGNLYIAEEACGRPAYTSCSSKPTKLLHSCVEQPQHIHNSSVLSMYFHLSRCTSMSITSWDGLVRGKSSLASMYATAMGGCGHTHV